MSPKNSDPSRVFERFAENSLYRPNVFNLWMKGAGQRVIQREKPKPSGFWLQNAPKRDPR